jgi:hypothetical protein
VPEPGVEDGNRAGGPEDRDAFGLLLGGVASSGVEVAARDNLQGAFVLAPDGGEVDGDLQGHSRLVSPEQPHVSTHEPIVAVPAVPAGRWVRRVDVEVGVVDVDVGREELHHERQQGWPVNDSGEIRVLREPGELVKLSGGAGIRAPTCDLVHRPKETTREGSIEHPDHRPSVVSDRLGRLCDRGLCCFVDHAAAAEGWRCHAVQSCS